jgi:two-component system, chemotaxis family, sensor kinase CheA
MNEMLAQFILESRELIEQATLGLAALEQSPHDAQWMDATFRAVHTLKGGAAIVEFHAMERLVHAAEDVMGAVRAGHRELDKATLAACLACLDQVERWLDESEQSGEVAAHADQQANALIARLGGGEGERKGAIATQWVDAFSERNAEALARAKSAVRLMPQSANFFQGEDPIALIASMPHLLALELEPIAGWPALDSFDPFESILILTALSGAPADEVRVYFTARTAEVEIVALDAAESSASDGKLPDSMQALLQAQLDLLDASGTSFAPGRVVSAARVVANALRYCADTQGAAAIDAALGRSLGASDPRALREQITLAMTGPGEQAVAPRAGVERREQGVRTLRVEAERVDALVRLTGELTVVKNALGHEVDLAQNDRTVLTQPRIDSLRVHHAALDHLVRELQRAVLGVRVLPLRTVLQRLPRLVREMSTSLDKPVNLLIEGEETEADKMIVEMLFEPLLHVVRNAMDHGIEGSAVRSQRGKPPVATLRIRASRQGGHVHIEVNDDGRGIDLARVRRKAAEQELLASDRLAALSDAEAIELIFLPGFSTAAAVTGLSGRGVGMDAVRNAVQRIGGRVAIETSEDAGTAVKFTLPFSVMMTQVLTVEVGQQMFGIPMDAVIETLSVPVDTIAGVGVAQAIVHRDRTIPIFELAGLLRLRSSHSGQDHAMIVVASFAGQLGGIRVDRLGERMEVMLKPLDGLLANLPGITGTSILGDGRVLLVLDLGEVLQ